jgi:2',3'-cyclic-nucleotide 2'-phosphodiesterase (5'-nucleotidase family)
VIKEWKEEGRDLLTLDAGDLFYPKLARQLSEDEKAVMNLKAKAIVASFNHMGVDAITVGDNDLVFGKENLLDILKEAEFPVVSANLIDDDSGMPLFQPYIIKELHGLRIGIFGLFPLLQGKEGNPIPGLTVLEPFSMAKQMVSILNGKADLVVLLSHLGYPKDQEVAQRIEGIHVIVGGHTGINLSQPRIVRNTMVLQVTRKGRYLGRADITVKDPSRPFVNVRTRDTLKRRLEGIDRQLDTLGGEAAQDSTEAKRRWEKLVQAKTRNEGLLKSYEGNNEVVNRLVALTDKIPADGDCEKIVEPYLLKIAEAEKGSPSTGKASGTSSGKTSK